jgi:hypothetical protein
MARAALESNLGRGMSERLNDARGCHWLSERETPIRLNGTSSRAEPVLCVAGCMLTWVPLGRLSQFGALQQHAVEMQQQDDNRH